MKSSLCILLSIFQDGKSVKDKEIFEIKAEQNHTLRSFFHLFFELQGKIYFVCIIVCENKTQSTLIIISEKLVVFNEGLCNCELCQLSGIDILRFPIISCCERCFMFDSKASIKMYFCNLYCVCLGRVSSSAWQNVFII